MYHMRFKGTPYEMGVKRGKLFCKCGITFPLRMDDFQMQHGIESEKLLKQYFPEVCEEVQGITDTIHVDYATFMSWMLAMGCCMYNLEENAPVEIRGCTAFAVVSDGKAYYGRNNDLPPFLKDGSKSEIYMPDHGNRFNITTSSFVNGEEGLNEKGLAVAMTFVSTELKNIKSGFTSEFIVRYLLEKADDVDMAKRLLYELPISSNCNILLADSNGAMIVVECAPDMKNVRMPIEMPNGVRMVCTVNSFCSDRMKNFEWDGEETYQSKERYATVERAMASYQGQNMIKYLEQLLKGQYGFMCQYEKKLNFQTIWSSIFDLSTLKIVRAEGDPRRKKFIEDIRLQK